ncbi:hypothetical protein AUEXF2481DRAFT_37079 [Aureobasidium subglaciale EXF-2481]|uniref:Uncharacterized protein n=1 Tax=Aureobasidium subglaciale (strain EXF-2481) TaxID=1043005 RepID=A0A074YQW1_AURSE|nr:uncharacterized protein AUEXF2481DRAFT_37079 [Aureobasidium subglaciale EXF-2481]KEQ98559.1 hypothetical protein AUEXF2481DRAFT_37079 [Aureobasidium subglaciale EXF-2481]
MALSAIRSSGLSTHSSNPSIAITAACPASIFEISSVRCLVLSRSASSALTRSAAFLWTSCASRKIFFAESLSIVQASCRAMAPRISRALVLCLSAPSQ